VSDATVTLVGNITSDPELRFGANGSGVYSSGIAVNDRKPDGNGGWNEETSFFNIVAFGTLAENMAASFQKGTRVVVQGVLKQRNYETKEGEKRSVVEVNVQSGGPDLRWATAGVERNEKGGGQQSKGSSKPRQAPRQQQPLMDEEPF
jgi:single-strand DNA-binding protein